MAFKLPAFNKTSRNKAGKDKKGGRGALTSVPLPLISRVPKHLQTPLVAGVALVALIALLAGAFLDYNITSSATRHLELASDLKFLTQRIAKDAAQAVQGNQTAIDGLPKDKEEAERIMAVLTRGNEKLAPIAGEPRAVLDQLTPVFQENMRRLQDVIDGRAGIQTVFAAVTAVEELTPSVHEDIQQLGAANAVDTVKLTRFALLMERISKDVTIMQGAGMKLEHISALGSDMQDAEALVASFNKANPVVVKTLQHFDVYRHSVEAII